MTQTFHQFEVDINQPPKQIVRSENQAQVTIGDLHANSLKFLFMLVTHGIIEINDQDYKRYVELYHKDTDDLTADDIAEIKNITANLTIKNPELLVRLIGDELADRGKNDLFILLLLKKLENEKVPYEILVSNHSITFLDDYETGRPFQSVLGYSQAGSSYNLQTLIDKGLVSRDEITEMVEQYYIPALKALSYSLSDDKQTITIYSHAPIDVGSDHTVKALAKLFNVEFNDSSAVELAKTIERINVIFTLHLKNHTLHTLYDIRRLGYETKNSTNALEVLTWNRGYRSINREPVHNGYHVNYVHGHDPSGPTLGNIINLDNKLGKIPQFHQGEYTATTTDDKPISSLNISESNELVANYTASLTSQSSSSNSQSSSSTSQSSIQQEEVQAVQIPAEYKPMFVAQLRVLKQKIDKLDPHQKGTAAGVAMANLHFELDAAGKEYFANDTTSPGGQAKFRKACLDALKDAKKSELATHRGIKGLILWFKNFLNFSKKPDLQVDQEQLLVPENNQEGKPKRHAFFTTDSVRKIDETVDVIHKIVPPSN